MTAAVSPKAHRYAISRAQDVVICATCDTRLPAIPPSLSTHNRTLTRGPTQVTCSDVSCRIVGRPLRPGEKHMHFKDARTGKKSPGFAG